MAPPGAGNRRRIALRGWKAPVESSDRRRKSPLDGSSEPDSADGRLHPGPDTFAGRLLGAGWRRWKAPTDSGSRPAASRLPDATGWWSFGIAGRGRKAPGSEGHGRLPTRSRWSSAESPSGPEALVLTLRGAGSHGSDALRGVGSSRFGLLTSGRIYPAGHCLLGRTRGQVLVEDLRRCSVRFARSGRRASQRSLRHRQPRLRTWEPRSGAGGPGQPGHASSETHPTRSRTPREHRPERASARVRYGSSQGARPWSRGSS